MSASLQLCLSLSPSLCLCFSHNSLFLFLSFYPSVYSSICLSSFLNNSFVRSTLKIRETKMHALSRARERLRAKFAAIFQTFSTSLSQSVCLFYLFLSVFQSSAFIFATSRQGQGHCTFMRRLELRKLRELNSQLMPKCVSSTFLLSLHKGLDWNICSFCSFSTRLC